MQFLQAVNSLFALLNILQQIAVFVYDLHNEVWKQNVQYFIYEFNLENKAHINHTSLGWLKTKKLFKVFQQVSYLRGIYISTSEIYLFLFFDMF